MIFLFSKLLRKKQLLTLLFFLFTSYLFSQELPPIQYYSPQDYNADDQNWSISQGKDETIYVANNKGLLEFNGARWTLNETSNQSIVRSVAVRDSIVYTGSYMDFGYWKRDVYGSLNYTSIVSQLEADLVEDEEFWNIIPYNQFVLFQSLDRIYVYDTSNNTFNIVASETAISKAYKVNGSIYFQKPGEGIFKIENGTAKLFSSDLIAKDRAIVNVFLRDGKLLFQTRNDGFYIYEDDEFAKWNISSNQLLSQVSVYNSIQLRNGNFILGTISNGVIKLDNNGGVLFQIGRNEGLSNNTVLSAFQDVSSNIWLGLDNGIALINLNSPYKIFNELNGDLGTVYASEKTKDFLYLGTNQGLFYKRNDSSEKFQLVPNTKGQVWFLKQIEETLLCGHDQGTFKIERNSATKISKNAGNWLIKPAEGKSNVLLSGNYDGLSVFEKTVNGNWIFKNKIEGFDISARYFEFVNATQILVSHEYKGVYLLNLNNQLDKVISFKRLDVEKGIGSSLVKFNGKVLYAYNDGVFQFNESSQVFKKSDLLSDYFTKANYISGKFVYDEVNNRLWNFFNNEITYVEPGKLTDKPVLTSIDLPNDLRRSKPGFENILHLSNNEYLLGATNGYIIINADSPSPKSYSVSIDKVLFSEQINTDKLVKLESNLELNNRENNLTFYYSISNFVKLSPALYQYRLAGIYDDWSSWSPKSYVLFENLPHGNYTFEVRARVGSNASTNSASFNFNIEKPWYLKPLAIVGYILVFLIIAAIIQYLNRLYYKKQKANLIKAKQKELEIKELEAQKQIMAFKNETLQKDIDNKSRELGLSTMTLIRKNEFLNTLKKELNTLEGTKELNKIIKIIDKNINNNEDWKFFEEAFNNADKDFLKKIKKIHPSLTPNDLKLCAYLRLNLSSKEIAPLLNISHRSVEVKRYRLRKKIELPHEASLTNYILDI